LYAKRDRPQPLTYSRFWSGYYAGQRPPGTIRVAPLVIELQAISELDMPTAYLATVAIGKLLVQGVRFTTPSLYIDLTTKPELPLIWPSRRTVVWPSATRVDDEEFEPMLHGKALRVLHSGIRLVPFKPATDLGPSAPEGSMLSQPVPCGKHYVYFPGILALKAVHHGKRCAFVTKCGCDIAYLVVLEADGAHFRNDDTTEQMAVAIEGLEGEEYEIRDENGYFYYKELT